jgi:hypothetical protein
VRSIPEGKTILFAPDRNLGRHIEKVTGREMVLWPGSCLVHETFSERKIVGLMERHPDAEIVAHPECEEAVLKHAAFIGSTTALLKHVVASEKKTFIVATEPGILHQMKKGAPDKELIAAPPINDRCACNECPHMKRNSLEKVYLALRDLSPRIEMHESLRERAQVPIDRMLALSLARRTPRRGTCRLRRHGREGLHEQSARGDRIESRHRPVDRRGEHRALGLGDARRARRFGRPRPTAYHRTERHEQSERRTERDEHDERDVSPRDRRRSTGGRLERRHDPSSASEQRVAIPSPRQHLRHSMLRRNGVPRRLRRVCIWVDVHPGDGRRAAR